MQIIGFVGPQGAGKTTATEHLEKQGYKVLEMRAAAVKEVKRLCLELNRVNLLKMGTKLRKELGMDYAAKYLAKLIQEKNFQKVVISGIRSNFEINHFRKQFPGFKVIAVNAPIELRYKRTKDRWASKEEFLSREEEENSWGIAGGLATADATIDNSDTLEEFLNKVDQWLSSNPQE